MCQFVWAAVVTVCLSGVAAGEEFLALVSKVEDSQVTIRRLGKGKKVGTDERLPLALKPKLSVGQFNKDTKKFEAGESLEWIEVERLLQAAYPRGVPAYVVVRDDDRRTVTAIRFLRLKKKAN